MKTITIKQLIETIHSLDKLPPANSFSLVKPITNYWNYQIEEFNFASNTWKNPNEFYREQKIGKPGGLGFRLNKNNENGFYTMDFDHKALWTETKEFWNKNLITDKRKLENAFDDIMTDNANDFKYCYKIQNNLKYRINNDIINPNTFNLEDSRKLYKDKPNKINKQSNKLGFGINQNLKSYELQKTNELDNYQSIKILGMKFNPIEHPRKISNFNEIFFIFIYKFPDLGYKMINSAIRYIISKFNFYISLAYTIHLKQVYKDWFIRELSNWLKANLVIVKESDNIIVIILNNNTIYQNSEQYQNHTKFGILYNNSNKIKFIFNIAIIKYKVYFNENRVINDYFILDN